MGSLPNLHELSKEMEEESPTKFNPLALNLCPYKEPAQDWKTTPRRKRSRQTACPTQLNNQKLLYARSTRRCRSTSVDRRFDNVVTLELLMLSNSPVSSRSTRSSSTAAVHYHNVQTNAKHRDSMASSSGTSSVKHLIDVVRSTPSQLGPVYSRRVICKNFAALSLAHAMLTAAFVPLFALQSSISGWWWSSDGSANHLATFNLNTVVGSLLLDITCTIAAVSSLFTPVILRKLGPNWTLVVCYAFACLFVGVHLYPTALFLIPGYLLMGVWLGPLVGARVTALMTLASKLTYVLSQDEEEEVDDAEGLGRREVMVHRLSRGLQVAQDFGLIVGNVVTALLLWYTPDNAQEIRDSRLALESMYIIEEGERVCGSSICPLNGYVEYNAPSTNTTVPLILSCKTSTLLASVCLGFCFMSLGVTLGLMDKIRMHAYQHSPPRPNFCVVIKGIKDTFKDPRLQLAAPLAVFIGLEQGFMYSDFTQSYVVCSLGISSVALVFISMGVMQSIAAFTINMVLQHMRRYYIIYVGFVFHSCLLLVLKMWKPAGDDPALFYVIAAAWGVCNAVWETLSFSLIVTLYPDSWQGAIGHNYFFRYLGLSLSFGLHGFVCNTLKLYTLAGALVLATVPYTWLEVRLDRLRRQRAQMSTPAQNY